MIWRLIKVSGFCIEDPIGNLDFLYLENLRIDLGEIGVEKLD